MAWTRKTLPSLTHSSILSVALQVSSLFQSECSKECNLLLPLSIYSIVSCDLVLPLSIYSIVSCDLLLPLSIYSIVSCDLVLPLSIYSIVSCDLVLPLSIYSIVSCDLVLPLSIYSIVSFPWGHLVAVYVFPTLLPSIFTSVTSFRRQFPRKMRPIQLPFLLFIVCMIFLSSLPSVSLLNFSHDRSNWSSLSFSSTTFQNFPGVSDLLPEAPKFQHHTQPCSKCSILLVYIYIYIYIWRRYK
jgi:hypothetical protein